MASDSDQKAPGKSSSAILGEIDRLLDGDDDDASDGELPASSRPSSVSAAELASQAAWEIIRQTKEISTEVRFDDILKPRIDGTDDDRMPAPDGETDRPAESKEPPGAPGGQPCGDRHGNREQLRPLEKPRREDRQATDPVTHGGRAAGTGRRELALLIRYAHFAREASMSHPAVLAGWHARMSLMEASASLRIDNQARLGVSDLALIQYGHSVPSTPLEAAIALSEIDLVSAARQAPADLLLDPESLLRRMAADRRFSGAISAGEGLGAGLGYGDALGDPLTGPALQGLALKRLARPDDFAGLAPERPDGDRQGFDDDDTPERGDGEGDDEGAGGRPQAFIALAREALSPGSLYQEAMREARDPGSPDGTLARVARMIARTAGDPILGSGLARQIAAALLDEEAGSALRTRPAIAAGFLDRMSQWNPVVENEAWGFCFLDAFEKGLDRAEALLRGLRRLHKEASEELSARRSDSGLRWVWEAALASPVISTSQLVDGLVDHRPLPSPGAPGGKVRRHAGMTRQKAIRHLGELVRLGLVAPRTSSERFRIYALPYNLTGV